MYVELSKCIPANSTVSWEVLEGHASNHAGHTMQARKLSGVRFTEMYRAGNHKMSETGVICDGHLAKLKLVVIFFQNARVCACVAADRLARWP